LYTDDEQAGDNDMQPIADHGCCTILPDGVDPAIVHLNNTHNIFVTVNYDR
jgi:hypothetical protein